ALDPEEVLHQLRRLDGEAHGQVLGAVEALPLPFRDEAAHGVPELGHRGRAVRHGRQSRRLSGARGVSRPDGGRLFAGPARALSPPLCANGGEGTIPTPPRLSRRGWAAPPGRQTLFSPAGRYATMPAGERPPWHASRTRRRATTTTPSPSRATSGRSTST